MQIKVLNTMIQNYLLIREFKSKSRFVGYFEFKTPKFLILDPKLVQTVLVKNFKNFHDNEFSKMVCVKERNQNIPVK